MANNDMANATTESNAVDDIQARGRERLAALHKTVTSSPTGRRRIYSVDDCLIVLTLMGRGHSLALIEAATGVHKQTAWLWKASFVNGTLEERFPNLAEAAANFDQTAVPEIESLSKTGRASRNVRARLAYRRPLTGNPYEGEMIDLAAE